MNLRKDHNRNSLFLIFSLMRRDEKKKLRKNRPDSPGLLRVERRQKKKLLKPVVWVRGERCKKHRPSTPSSTTVFYHHGYPSFFIEATGLKLFARSENDRRRGVQNESCVSLFFFTPKPRSTLFLKRFARAFVALSTDSNILTLRTRDYWKI